MKNVLPFLASVLILSGCAFDKQFREPTQNQPHAIVSASNDLRLMHINEQPTSFWRTSENFRIPLGPTIIRPIAEREPYDFEPLHFAARSGYIYEIRHEVSAAKDEAVLYEVTNSKPPRAIFRGNRFGKNE